MLNLGCRVKGKNSESKGTIVGFYNPFFYVKYLLKKTTMDGFEIWNKDYPDWKLLPLAIIYFDEPSKNMTKEEVRSTFYLNEVSDETYNKLTLLCDFMVLPYDAVEVLEGELA